MLWCKVDANLDTNPKISKAGFWGSVVFQLILRLNKLRDGNGVLPLSCIDGGYLARLLNLHDAEGLDMDAESLCRMGVKRLIDATALHVSETHVTISGFDEAWSKLRPGDHSTERVREWRQKNPKNSSATEMKRSETHETQRNAVKRHKSRVDQSRDPSSTVVADDQIKKNTEDQDPKCDPRAIALAKSLHGLIARRLPNAKSVQNGTKTIDQWSLEFDRTHRLDRRPWDRMAEVLAWSQQDSFWQANILSAKKFRAQYDALEAKMAKSAGRPAPRTAAEDGYTEITGGKG